MMHEKIAECIRDMAKQLIEDADKIALKVDKFRDFSITIDIPTATDSPLDAPSYSVGYSYYPKYETITKFLDIKE